MNSPAKALLSAAMAFLLLILPLAVDAQYSRSNWGGWRGGCHDTRNLVLERDSKAPVEFKTDKRCKVASGVWTGTYSNADMYFPADIQIDHVVPLKNAYDSGAANWTRSKKREYFNDLQGLVASRGRENMQKGARGPSEWLPAFNRCWYVGQWLAIKERYELTLTVREARAIWKVLESCN